MRAPNSNFQKDIFKTLRHRKSKSKSKQLAQVSTNLLTRTRELETHYGTCNIIYTVIATLSLKQICKSNKFGTQTGTAIK